VDIVSRFAVDDGELSRLHARAFGGDPALVEPWARRLERHALTWVGAVEAGRLAGFVEVAWNGGQHAFLLDTVVDPDWQHRGIGARLVQRAAEEAGAAGCTWLHVDFEPHLEGFYLHRCGFRASRAGLIRLPVSKT
jgi:GNAT superfamily N-acetyltransferase